MPGKYWVMLVCLLPSLVDHWAKNLDSPMSHFRQLKNSLASAFLKLNSTHCGELHM